MSANMDKDLFQNYIENERIQKSSNASVSEKAAAWRQQAIILSHLQSKSSQPNDCSLLEQHYSKVSFDDFLQERLNNVDSLLEGFHKDDADGGKCEVDDFPELDETVFEIPCHKPSYESCRHNEVTTAQLELLGGSSLNEINGINKPSTSNCPSTSRNCIKNFLQSKSNELLTCKSHNTKNRQAEEFQRQSVAGNTHIAESSNSTVNNIGFRTAREELEIQNLKKNGLSNATTPLFNYGTTKKSLGSRRTVRSNFVPPIRPESNAMTETGSPSCTPPDAVEPTDERLLNIEPKMIDFITNEIINVSEPVDWNDIAGLDYAKSIIKEAVVYPLLRPDIFTGLRRPPRGFLLFGPSGTGKTLIGKCIASQSNSTFFCISASSLTSKWIGDGEKMVRALFAVAAVRQPSVIFIDEIDSLLSQRSENEHESSRRLKTEFLVQLDGAATSDADRILIVGATNRPQELDEGARRRLVRRLYIPLPELDARIQIIQKLLQGIRHNLNMNELKEIGTMSDGYSGADMKSLCREASMEPIRAIPPDDILHFKEDNVRPVELRDFQSALQSIRPSVSQDDLKQYTEWNRIYGAMR